MAQTIKQPPEWTFGDRLRKARRHAGLSQEQLADALAIGRERYSGWETGRGRPPGGDEFVKLAKRAAEATEVPLEWLLGLEISSLLDPSGSPLVDCVA